MSVRGDAARILDTFYENGHYTDARVSHLKLSIFFMKQYKSLKFWTHETLSSLLRSYESKIIPLRRRSELPEAYNENSKQVQDLP